MKKLTPHHHLTPKGGRRASRVRPGVLYKIASKVTAAVDPIPTFFFPNIRRTRTKGA